MPTRKHQLLGLAGAAALFISHTSTAIPLGTTFFTGVDNRYVVEGVPLSGGQLSGTGPASVSETLVTPNSTVSNFAEADLSAGTLKASSSVSGHNSTLSNLGSVSVSAAQFGDSFSHATGNNQPFLFANNETATFNLSVDGSFGRSSLNSPSGTLAEAYLNIFIFQPGSLDQVITSEFGRVGIFNESFQPITASYLIDHASYGLTPQSQLTNNYAATGTLSAPLDNNPAAMVPVDGFLSSGDIVEFTFNPGGDFDWIIELTTAAAVDDEFNPLFGEQFAFANFANTVNVDYIAPVGVNFSSASGVFPNSGGNSAAVPISSTLFLLSLGGALLMFSTKRNQL